MLINSVGYCNMDIWLDVPMWTTNRHRDTKTAITEISKLRSFLIVDLLKCK